LQLAAQRLVGCLREGDTIRWGGDEFTLHTQITCAEDAAACPDNSDFLQNSMITSFTSPLVLNCFSPYAGEDAETLLKNADTSMYRAKPSNKDNFQLYTPEMNTKALEQLVLATTSTKH